MDVFGYRSSLSQDQFFQEGFAERKLILLLDIYDYIKEVKRHMRISSSLASTDIAQPYASDVPQKVYEVINHRKGEAVKFEFNMNATLQKSKNTVVARTDIPAVG